MAQLIVNADDFARNPEVDRGILSAHQHGIVTTTTVLINMPGALESIQQAHASAPDLGFGLHLNLTLGYPCSEARSQDPLTGEDGRFHPLRYWYRHPNEIPIESISAEWHAQVNFFLSTGVTIDHLDSHHHIAAIRKDIWDLYLTLANDLGCGVRPPTPDDVSDEELARVFPEMVLEHARSDASVTLRQRGIPHPTTFLASFFNGQAHLDHLLNLLAELPDGVSELMCHPGYSSAELESTSGYATQRIRELEALTDPRTIQQVDRLQIELVTYRQVWSSA